MMERKIYKKNRTEKLYCRLTKEEKSMLEQKAEKKDLSITEYIVSLVAKD